MPELDWRDVRTGDLSLADELDFAKFRDTLTHEQRRIVDRGIASAVHSDAADERSARILQLRDELEHAESEVTRRGDEIKDLTAERATLHAENRRLEGEIAEADINIANLRRELTEAEARHGREMQEAEVRGYQRGRSEVAA